MLRISVARWGYWIVSPLGRVRREVEQVRRKPIHTAKSFISTSITLSVSSSTGTSPSVCCLGMKVESRSMTSSRMFMPRSCVSVTYSAFRCGYQILRIRPGATGMIAPIGERQLETDLLEVSNIYLVVHIL